MSHMAEIFVIDSPAVYDKDLLVLLAWKKLEAEVSMDDN